MLTLKYAEIKPDHLSMLLMGLNAYPEARFSSKLQRLLLECCVHMPLEQFEVRTRPYFGRVCTGCCRAKQRAAGRVLRAHAPGAVRGENKWLKSNDQEP